MVGVLAHAKEEKEHYECHVSSCPRALAQPRISLVGAHVPSAMSFLCEIAGPMVLPVREVLNCMEEVPGDMEEVGGGGGLCSCYEIIDVHLEEWRGMTALLCGDGDGFPWGGWVEDVRSWLCARSLAVSVAAQKNGGLSLHPICIEVGMTNSGLSV